MRHHVSRRVMSVITAVTVTVTTVVAPTAGADRVNAAVSAQIDPSVPGRGISPATPKPNPEAEQAPRRPQPVWPSAGGADVVLKDAGTRVGDLPVRLSHVTGTAKPAGRSDAAGAPSRVRLDNLNQAQVGALGGVGYAMTLRRTDDEARPGPVRVTLDYSGFRYAYGANFADRLRLVRLPGCAVSRPNDPACASAVQPVKQINDQAAGLISAEVEASPSAAAPAEAVYVLVAAAAGASTGDFRATDLKPSGKWQVGLPSGSFGHSYPFTLPPPQGGKAPAVGLSYDSGSVDGRTSATNNQASWAGLGWELNPGFIERKYRACADDDHPTWGDLCWHSPYSGNPGEDGAAYVISLNGVTTELIRASDGTFHLKDDQAWRLEHKTGGSNDDNTDEYWVVSTPDGAKYTFGYRADSNLTVPVISDDSDEPCYSSNLASCRQTYRWNLDKIVDANDNVTTLYYGKETNNYKRVSSGNMLKYDRGAYLDKIEYGGVEGERPNDQIDFTVVGRCTQKISDPAASCPSLSSANASSWPDVPVDQVCADGATCTKTSPTFFVSNRLDAVSARVWDPNSSAYGEVARWKPKFSLPKPPDNSDAVLWLDAIQYTGTFRETVTLPVVNFDGVWERNRVDYSSTKQQLYMKRLGVIRNGLGGEIRIDYGHASTEATCPTGGEDALGFAAWEAAKKWDSNTQECYRVDFLPDGSTTLEKGIFHKYVVKRVEEVDLVGGSPTVRTDYTYLDDAAWHYDDDMVLPSGQQKWGDWRGYQTVRTTKGTGANEQRTITEQRFFRGMHDDTLSGGGQRTATVTDYEDNPFTDYDRLNGKPLHTQSFRLNADGTRTELGSRRHTYWNSPAPTANGPGLHNAWMVRPLATYGRARKADGTMRRTTDRTDGHTVAGGGLATREFDGGDDATDDDNTCTEITYAQNTAGGEYFLSPIETTELHDGNADTQTPNQCPGNAIARTTALYDNAAAPGSTANKPTDGNPTEVRTYTGDTTYTRVRRSYDVYGRILDVINGRDKKTSTVYSPTTGWPANGVTVTEPVLTNSTTTYPSPAFGLPERIVDPNGLNTIVDYDGVGRLRRVWLPTEPRPGGCCPPPSPSATPSMQFSYRITTGSDGQPNKPTVVTSQQLQSGTGTGAVWLRNHAYLDGFGRLRETQTPSPAAGGGRIVTVTTYDERGLAKGTSGPIYNTTTPADNPDLMLNPAPNTLPSWTETSYDALERQSVSALYNAGSKKWQTVTDHFGDLSILTPPRGGRTATLVDVKGRTAKIIENVPAGVDVPPTNLPTTSYTYSRRGDLTQITDPNGNVTTMSYDWAGRRLTVKDPDAGLTTNTYYPDDLLFTSTDPRGNKITYNYDANGRKTHEWLGDIGVGTKLAEWTYDSTAIQLGKGKPAAAIRYRGGQVYHRSEATGYDPRGRPTGQKISIPGEPTFGGPYTYGFGYDKANHQTDLTYPAAGGKPAEKATTAYDTTGRPTTLTSDLNGGYTYVKDTHYSGLGQLARRDHGPAGGIQRGYTYDAATGRLATMETQSGTDTATPTLLQRDGYDYDQVGNLTSIIDRTVQVGGVDKPQTQCFAYDPRDRLAAAWTTTANGCSGGLAQADKLGPDPYKLEYAYDNSGNLTKVTDDGAERRYTYPAQGPGSVRPHAVTAVTGGTAGDNSYSYDPAGNLTNRTTGTASTTFTWDELGKLTKAATSSGDTTFAYTADGDRLLRRDPAGATLYLPGMELRATGATVKATRYYTCGGATIALRRTDDTAPVWLLNDTQASTQLSVEGWSGIAHRQRYLPYGAHRGGRDDITATERGFLGKTEDPTTGLVTTDNRYYDPSIGRFISPDPLLVIDDPGQLNPYGYAGNNPTTYSDPSGLTRCDVGACPTPEQNRCAPGLGGCTDTDRDGIPNGMGSNGRTPGPNITAHGGGEGGGSDDHPAEGKKVTVGIGQFRVTTTPEALRDVVAQILEEQFHCTSEPWRCAGDEGTAREWARTQVLGALICERVPSWCTSRPQSEWLSQAISISVLFGALGSAGGRTSGSAAGQKLANKLRFESAKSPFTPDGRLTPEAIANSKLIIPGSKLNKELRARFAERGGVSQWGKYTTTTHQSPYGDFQAHFYRNSVTGEVMYNYDYKVVMNRR